MRVPLLCFLLFEIIHAVVGAEPSWTKVPIRAPPHLLSDRPNMPYYRWHYAEVHVGKPPQAQQLAISLHNLVTYLYAPNCTYCPYYNNYGPSFSDSFKVEDAYWPSSLFQAVRATELLAFGRLDSPDTPIGIVEFMNKRVDYRPREGVLGLFNHPQNSSLAGQNVLHKLHLAGKLLNPVIGLKLGGPNPSLSIGALDPADYEGELNWVQASPFDPSLTAEVSIPIEAIRGWDGNVYSLPYPLDASLDSTTTEIYLPAALNFLGNKTLLGPQASLWQNPANPFQDFRVSCSVTLDNLDFSGVNIPFSVDINGVNYPVESKDLVRPQTSGQDGSLCRVGFQNSTLTPGVPPVVLGLPFLRSVYLAYRFPTDDCPVAHYAFAFPRGLNRTRQVVTQAPRTTPAFSPQCLQFKPANTAPLQSSITPIVKPDDEVVRTPGPEDVTWKVHGQPDKQVLLIGVEDLPELIEKAGKK